MNQVSISPERAENLDFSSSYYDTAQAVVTVEGSPAAGRRRARPRPVLRRPGPPAAPRGARCGVAQCPPWARTGAPRSRVARRTRCPAYSPTRPRAPAGRSGRPTR
ncbi:hypothetical protein [Cellulomonas denverensis]|uniref:hypothetical protein n=1 Tax=Cellulomonas denverensis TaxID=264297 RepID=UPI003CD0D98E